MEKDGGLMVVGDTVMRDALQNNDKYDKGKAKVERLNVRAAVATILEGPALARSARWATRRSRFGLAGRLRKTTRRRYFLSLRFVCGRFSCGLSGL